jgi:hypothetical protein
MSPMGLDSETAWQEKRGLLESKRPAKLRKSEKAGDLAERG